MLNKCEWFELISFYQSCSWLEQYMRIIDRLMPPKRSFVRIGVCVILYFYPATCGPKGHGSGSAAAEGDGGELFTYNLFPGHRPALQVIVGPPTLFE